MQEHVGIRQWRTILVSELHEAGKADDAGVGSGRPIVLNGRGLGEQHI